MPHPGEDEAPPFLGHVGRQRCGVHAEVIDVEACWKAAANRRNLNLELEDARREQVSLLNNERLSERRRDALQQLEAQMYRDAFLTSSWPDITPHPGADESV